MSAQYRLLIRAENPSGAVRQQTYDEDDCVTVRDLTSRCTGQVRVREISVYRHILLLDGQAFQILNMFRPR